MTKEIIQESNPELKNLSLFCPTPMHIIMKFHTTHKEKILKLQGEKVGHILRIQNESGNIMASDFSLATLKVEGNRTRPINRKFALPRQENQPERGNHGIQETGESPQRTEGNPQK